MVKVPEQSEQSGKYYKKSARAQIGKNRIYGTCFHKLLYRARNGIFVLDLRQVNRGDYPELSGYTSRDIWRNIGPGGLYLVTRMARLLDLKAGDVVLDLGCGKGESSIFLAKHYDVKVFALDLWVNANTMFKHIIESGVSDVIPLNLDASKPLPFAGEYFDVIFCMNSLSFFGGDLDTVSRLSSHLRGGGVFCVGGETLSCEFSDEQLENPPQVYNFAESVWQDDFLKLHSPPWWGKLFTQVDGLEVFHCEELPDGRIMYEDQIQHSHSDGYLGLNRQQAYELEMRQIEYGRTNEPYMTIYILAAKKK